jgi:hypothetical protein
MDRDRARPKNLQNIVFWLIASAKNIWISLGSIISMMSFSGLSGGVPDHYPLPSPRSSPGYTRALPGGPGRLPGCPGVSPGYPRAPPGDPRGSPRYTGSSPGSAPRGPPKVPRGTAGDSQGSSGDPWDCPDRVLGYSEGAPSGLFFSEGTYPDLLSRWLSQRRRCIDILKWHLGERGTYLGTRVEAEQPQDPAIFLPEALGIRSLAGPDTPPSKHG